MVASDGDRPLAALRDEPGSGSESRDGWSLAWEAAGEKDAEPVVVEVAEAAPGPLDVLDQQVGGFDLAVRCAGGVVGEDLVAPPAQGLRQGAQLGSGFGSRAP